MRVEKFEIAGPMLLEPKVMTDNRGFFTERFRADLFGQQGIAPLVQDNFSRSAAKVLRGLHYQLEPTQAKLVTVTRGTVFDAIVDIRRSSPTFGNFLTFELSADRPQWIWVPSGFAHGFLVTSPEGADLLYKVDSYYNAGGEGGIRFDDSDLKIPWPVRDPILSERDSGLPSWKAFLAQS